MEIFHSLLILLAVSAATGELIKCYDCLHLEYSTSDSTLDDFLSQISVSDANCKRHGNDYVPDDTVTCVGTCYKEMGTVRLSFYSPAIVELSARGCADFYKSDQCTDVTVESLFTPYGIAVDHEDMYGCYCNSDKCNHGNSVLGNLVGVLFIAVVVSLAVF